jgi:uncharacterized protein (UPF0276 family)
LLAPTDGFLLLDLHDIYCQVKNFDLEPEPLLKSYPLARVRELHVSGGSWSESTLANTPPIRRDTHDEAVREDLWPLLHKALQLCPNVQAVIFERLGGTIPTEHDAAQFRDDYARLRHEVQSAWAKAS